MDQEPTGVWIVEEQHRDNDGDDGGLTLYGCFATAEDAGEWMDDQPDDEDTTEMAAVFMNIVNEPARYVIVASSGQYGTFDEDTVVTGPFPTPEQAFEVLHAMYPEEAGMAATVVRVGEVPTAEDLAETAERRAG